MAKNNKNNKQNEMDMQPDTQSKETEEQVQMEKQQENAVSYNNNTMESAMKDLQQKIQEAKNNKDKGEAIQNAVFEMLQNMGLKIPPKVIDKMKNKGGKK